MVLQKLFLPPRFTTKDTLHHQKINKNTQITKLLIARFKIDERFETVTGSTASSSKLSWNLKTKFEIFHIWFSLNQCFNNSYISEIKTCTNVIYLPNTKGLLAVVKFFEWIMLEKSISNMFYCQIKTNRSRLLKVK